MLRAQGTSGHIAVADTNVLRHYQPPAEIDWAGVVGGSPVRLVVPLRVIEELDAKKYARRDDLAGRARSVLPILQRTMGNAGARGQLRKAVTVEVPIDPGTRFRPLDADEEILETCHELRQFSGRPVALVTGDTGMTLRAEAQESQVASMPDKYLRNPSSATRTAS
jgi:predicted ribonuclease YlaK